MRFTNKRWAVSSVLPLLVGCAADTGNFDEIGSRGARITERSLPNSPPPQLEPSAPATRSSTALSPNASTWTSMHSVNGVLSPEASAPPEMTIKLNDNLSSFTSVLVPALARSYGLNGMSLPALPLISDTTKADMGILGDIFFACHDDSTPVVLELRNLYMDMGVHDDSFDIRVGGSSTYGSSLTVEAELPDFSLSGRLYFDWPANKQSFWCNTFGNDFHAEVPFTVSGASLRSAASFKAENGGLLLNSISLSKLSIHDISFDSGIINGLGDAGLAITDTVVSAFQDLQDGLHQVDLQPENGICNTAGSTADLEACVEAVVSGYVSQTLLAPNSKYRKLIFDTVRIPTPAATTFNVGSYSMSVAPEIVNYTESNDKDNIKLNVTLLPTSTRPTAACAASVTPAPPHGNQGSFDPMKDVDMVVPFDNIEAVFYEFTRQGMFCLPAVSIGVASASIDPSGPVTISNQAIMVASSTPVSTASSTASGTSTGAASRARTANGNLDLDATTSTSSIGSVTPPADLYTTHPMKLTFTAGSVSGSITLRAELGWTLDFTCGNQLAVELVSAKRVSLTGSVTIPGLGTVDMDDALVRSQIDAQLTRLPSLIPQIPLGPSVIGLPAGTYLELKDIQTSSREIAFGLKLRDTVPQACTTSGSSGWSYGDDVQDGDDLPALDGTLGLPHDRTNTGGTVESGVPGGAPGAATTAGVTVR